ncbi:hypothetical protein [Halarchaeum nitratireducens]|uniref:Uncharacterized protein n=1 Tax=Halarchaeum nitratireducens TaxID=489913 RepID=A0A830GF34_9EURY|nr:hypothetical protein [Halarchaeum nitratireducens]GGN25079.1 hypothetical protein GCM10009021_28700 [Halarchaeum nitratireducens]
MAKTVDELRNDIRVGTGRFEREISATFTKEDLAAICDALNYEIDTDSLPPKPQMRAGILAMIGERDDATDGVDRAFRKAELEAIAAALDE